MVTTIVGEDTEVNVGYMTSYGLQTKVGFVEKIRDLGLSKGTFKGPVES